MSKIISKLFIFLFLMLFSSSVFSSNTCTVEVENAVITDSDLNQVITITFNQDMNIDYNPDINFNNAIIGTWTEISESIGWTDSNIYTYAIAIPDANEESTVPVIVSGAIGLDGNPMDVNNEVTFLIDTKEPTGYSVDFDQDYVNSTNISAISFTFTTAELGATFNYSIDDSNIDTNAESNSGTIADVNGFVIVNNLSGLNDGTLTLSVTLTDTNGNISAAVEDTIVKDTIAPVLSQITIPNRFGMTLSFNEDVNFDTNSEDTISKITVNGEEDVVSEVEFGDNIVTFYFYPAFFTDLNIDSFVIDENAFVDLYNNSLPEIDGTYLGSIIIDDNAFPYSMVDPIINDENHLIIRLTEALYLEDGNQLQDGNDLTDYYLTYDVNTDNFSAIYHYDDENGYYIDFVTTDSNDGATIIIDDINYPLVDDSNNPYTPIHLLLDGGSWSFKRIVSDGDTIIDFEPDDSSYSIIIPSDINSELPIDLNLSGILYGDYDLLVPDGDDFFLERQTATTKYSVTIPAGTTITGEDGWDGLITLPIITDNFTITNGAADVTINIGSGFGLTFDKAVKILIGDMNGKSAAYNDGTTHLITACNTDLSDANSETATTDLNSWNKTDCSSSNGTDLIIWTKHFTDFAAYTPTEEDDDGGPGGGSDDDEEEDEDEASCSDIDITTTSITIYSDSTSTKSIALINDSEDFDFEIEDITITEATGIDVSIVDEPEDVASEDSEYLKIELETDEFSSATTKTIELEIEGVFDDDDETDCSIDQDISVRIQLVSADEEGEEPEVVEADTNATTYNGNTSDDGAIDGTTDDSGANAISDKTEQSVTPTKKKSNDWLFWLLDLSIVVVIIALVLIIKKKKDPRRSRL